MVINFEEYTYDLTADERKLAKILHDNMIVHHKGVDNAVKEREIVKWFKSRGYKMTGARLRKIVGFLRYYYLPNLIATSKGYYLSDNPGEQRRYLLSMKQRASKIMTLVERQSKALKIEL